MNTPLSGVVPLARPLVLGLLIFTGAANAANLEVDRRGLTPGAYTSLSQAALAVRAGDSIVLIPGSGPYRETLDIKQFGTAEAPIVVEGNGELITGFEPFVFEWNPATSRWEFVLPAPIGNQADGTENAFRHLVTYQGHRILKARVGGALTSDAATLSDDGLRLILGNAAPDQGWEIGTRSLGVRVAGLNTDQSPVAWHHRYRNLRVSGARNDGFNLHGTGTNLEFENIEAFHNFDEGFSAHDSIHCSIDGGVFWGNDNGLYNQSSPAISMRVNHVRAYANLGVGISMRQGATEIRNSQAWDNGVLNLALGGTLVMDSVSIYQPRWSQPPFVAYQEAQGQAIGQSYPYPYEAYWRGQEADATHQAYVLTGTEPAVLTESRLPPFALSYADWRYAYFSAAEIGDVSTSGPASDPDSDGRSNQDEYQLGTDPLLADGVFVIAAVAVPDATARAADGDSARIVLRRSGNTDAALMMYFTIGGSATADTDYEALPNFVEIPAGALSAELVLVPLERGAQAPPTQAVLSLLADDGYRMGPASGTVIVDPQGLPVVTLSVLDASASERTGEDAAFRVRRSGATSEALSVTVSVFGTATADEDYPGFGTSVDFLPGQDAVDLRVVAVEDGLNEVNETVVLRLTEQPGYTLANAFGSITIEGLPLPTLTLAATDTAATEAPGNPGAFTFTRSSGDAALTVFFTLAGTATAGADYTAPGGSAVIPAGASSVDVLIVPVDDGLAESSESVTMSLAAADTYVRGSPRSGTVTIANFTPGTVSITTTDPSASEAAGNTGTFSISRSGPRTSALRVRYSVDGTATPDADYTSLPGLVEIAAGAGSATVVIEPRADTQGEGDETVRLTLAADGAYLLGTGVIGTVTIKDVPPPVVSLVVNDGAASESGGDTGLITIRRSGSTAQSLDVTLSLGGTATPGSDYDDLGTRLVIPPGASAVAVSIRPLADLLSEGGESVVLTLAAEASYALGGVSTGTVTIADVAASTVSLSVIDANASEAGSDTASFRISRSAPTGGDLSVMFTRGGSAALAGDYLSESNPVVIPAGAGSAIVTIVPQADAEAESAETVTLELQASGAYILGASSAASITIYDAAPPTVTLSVTDASASEAAGNGGEFLLSRTGPVDGPLSVALVIGGTASNGEDYRSISSPIEIPTGAGSATITITPRADTLAEPTETVTLALAADASYLPGASTGGSVSIANATPPTVTLTVNDGSASESPGNGGLLSINRTGSKTGPLTVFYVVSGTATAGADYQDLGSQVVISAGAGSATVAISTVTDALVEGTETVVVSLVTEGGYVLGSSYVGTVNILDVPLPTTSVTVNDSSASEAPGNSGLITISRSGSRTAALRVTFTLGGSATPGLDYEDPGVTVLIPAGAGSATVTVSPLADIAVEGPESATLSIAPSSDYRIGPSGSGTVNTR